MDLELVTARARLRRFHQNDLFNLIRLESDPEVVKHTRIRTPRTMEQSKQRLRDQIARSQVEAPLGIWAAEFKDSGEFIGWFMLIPNEHKGAELGYMICRDLWGQGLATEIAEMLVEKAFFMLNLSSLQATTDEDNLPSESILKKIGFLFKGHSQIEKAKYFEIKNHHWQPYLIGNLISTEPMREENFDELYSVAKDPLIWELHPNKLRYQRDVFRQFFESGINKRGALLLRSTQDRSLLGSSSFYEYSRQENSVVIGYTFLSRACWGGPFNKELKRLMLEYAFNYVKTVYFDVGEANFRSQKALEKIGAELIKKRNAIDGMGQSVLNLRYCITEDKFKINPFWRNS